MQNRKQKKLSLASRVSVEMIESRLMMSGGPVSPLLPGQIVYMPPVVVSPTGGGTPEGSVNPLGAPITPALMRDAYGLGTYGSSPVAFNGVQGTGAGQTIVLIEAASDPYIAADMTGFDNYWGLPAPPSLVQLNQTGGTTLTGANGSVDGELDLDVEWAHVMAPQANLVIYEGSNLYTAMTTAAAAPGVSVISTSYGIGGVEGLSEFETPAGHAGVTFTASSGDTGGEVIDPSMSPAVVSVGGTTLSMNGTNYGSESAWSSGGGGINTNEAQPSYQTGIVSAYSTTNRTEPDVAMDADPNSGVGVYDIENNGTSAPWDEVIGGTSLSSPLMAGIIAIADQGRAAAGLTSLDGYTQTLPRLYSLATTDFHDITTGNNSHAATAGYDLATGFGSPVGNKLIPDLAGADTITGEVFTDVNGNGVYDGSDTPITGKTVYLDLKNTGVQTSNDPVAVTNSSGGYIFSDQIGSETGTIRLASPPAGDLHTTTPTAFTTSYDQTQTVNLGFYPVTNTVVATPSPVTGKITSLSLSGTTTVNASTYLYTWSTISTPTGGTVTFATNGTNASATDIATFKVAGSYTFNVKITDGQGSTVNLSSGTITVAQTATTVVVAPSTITIFGSGSTQLTATAYDQFGTVFTTAPTFIWTVDSGGVGSVSSTGLYSASTGGTATVRATTGSVSATSAATVVPPIISGTSGNDTIRLVRSGANELIYVNNQSSPLYNVPYSALGNLTIASGSGIDTVNIDFSGGATPVPTGGITVNSGATSGNDTLLVTGTAGNDVVSVGASNISIGGSTIAYGNINSIVFNGNYGFDTLTQTAQPGNSASLVFNGGGSVAGPNVNDTLNVSAGTFTFAAPSAGTGFNPISLSKLNVSASAVVALKTAAAHSDRSVLVLSTLSVNAAGQLDLGGNDMIVHFGNYSGLTTKLATGSAKGNWNGLGISSSAANADSTHHTALGILTNADINGNLVYPTFDNQAVETYDVLVKYTYVGDTNLDGQVDGSDYSNIDNGFVNALTGWSNGDLNYDGVIDGSDYTLIDNTFNIQGASLASAVATPQVATAGKSASQRSTHPAALPPSQLFASSTPITSGWVTNSNSVFWKWYDKSAPLV